MDIWPVIHDQRKALAADLKGRGGEEWAMPSLCSQWTVRDVLAHMTSAATLTPPAFFGKLIGSGFNFEKVQASGIAANRGSSPADTMARFEAVLTSVKHPPGPADTWLGETIVHAEDIRRPLGIVHHYPTDAVVQVASFYQGSNLLIGSKRRIEGLTLRATDADWSHGTGPEVAGPILSLVQAMTGRKAPIDDLTGEGVATLRSRS
ncbi:MAG TPA: maleylpyruvate isomerase family mycothiol-dependent enzyme [Streptosporangiaceae bacterium]|nr:maleylpyruvate isomerase family mycothiol-dependent enzyme [Streptosporangiaceae bacterium]